MNYARHNDKMFSRPAAASRAFTLIELLIALSIIVIILVAVNTVFFSAIHLKNRAASMVDNSHNIEQALTIVRRDLLNTFPPDGTMSQWFIVGAVSPYAQMTAMNRSTDNSQSDTNISTSGVTTTGMSALNSSVNTSGGMQSFGIQFFTTTGLVNDNDTWGELQRVTLQLQPALRRDSPGSDLVRSVSRVLLATSTMEEPAEEHILTGVDSFDIECYSGTQWINFWDTTSGDEGLPKAVRLRIQFASETRNASRPPIEMVIPFSVQSITNQVDSSITNSTNSTQ
jgi:prepilin-type N-terminal cleavage/methylation domain-containing protein